MIRSGAMGSRISQMTMVDILYTAVSSRMYDKVKPYLDKTRLTSRRKRFHGKKQEG
jgi:DNA-binding MurR/RpiR family transcriptional regulator